MVENYSLAARFFDYYFSLALKKNIVFFTQSLGPFKTQQNKLHIKKIFDKAALILLRDQQSLDNLEQINVNTANARVCSDIVFAVADKEVLQKAKTTELNKNLKIGISVREWPYFKNPNSKNEMERYKRSVATLCEYITTDLNGDCYLYLHARVLKNINMMIQKWQMKFINYYL